MKVNKLKLGIVGHGFVGQATDWGFNKNVTKFIVDPKYKYDIEDLSKENPDIVFVCVPTPMAENGEQDDSIVVQVVRDLSHLLPNAIIVIKSTVLPSVLNKLRDLSSKLIFNPEFLREKHANEDFINSKLIIFGGEKKLCKEVSKIYLENSRCLCREHIFVDLISASIIKYAINTFLATKVIFFNEIFALHQAEGGEDWKGLISALAIDDRIGSSHLDVPGHDGRYGFGGACFPKDTLALFKYAQAKDVNLSVLKSAILKNNQIRSKYFELESREKEQNVSFIGKI